MMSLIVFCVSLIAAEILLTRGAQPRSYFILAGVTALCMWVA